MKLPRHVDGDELARLIYRYGYHIVHQTGSHQRLSAVIAGRTHDLTIPRHRPLRVGTLHRILKDVAEHQKISREQINCGIVWIIVNKASPRRRETCGGRRIESVYFSQDRHD